MCYQRVWATVSSFVILWHNRSQQSTESPSKTGTRPEYHRSGVIIVTMDDKVNIEVPRRHFPSSSTLIAQLSTKYHLSSSTKSEGKRIIPILDAYRSRVDASNADPEIVPQAASRVLWSGLGTKNVFVWPSSQLGVGNPANLTIYDRKIKNNMRKGRKREGEGQRGR